MLSLKGERLYGGLGSMNGDGIWSMGGINKVATTFGFWGKTIRISWIGIGLKAIPMEHQLWHMLLRWLWGFKDFYRFG